MLNKSERTEIKKKSNRLSWIGNSLALFGVLMLVLFFVIEPLGNLFREGFNSENFGIQMLSLFIMMCFTFFPIVSSFGFVSFSSMELKKLHQWRRDVNDQRNKFQMKRFWEAVRANDYELAMDIYNADGLIWGSERTLCNGILMGIATLQPIDVEWSKKVDDRMKSYL